VGQYEGGRVAPRQECARPVWECEHIAAGGPLPCAGLPRRQPSQLGLWFRVTPPEQQIEQQAQERLVGQVFLVPQTPSLSSVSRPWKNGEMKNTSFPVPLTCRGTSGQPLPVFGPQFPHLWLLCGAFVGQNHLLQSNHLLVLPPSLPVTGMAAPRSYSSLLLPGQCPVPAPGLVSSPLCGKRLGGQGPAYPRLYFWARGFSQSLEASGSVSTLQPGSRQLPFLGTPQAGESMG
jgi:hypothetical protein